VLVDAASDTCVAAPLSSLAATAISAGGLGAGGAQDGSAGTVSLDGQIIACADPIGLTASRQRSGSPSIVNATDGLFVLRAAVGLECCALCVCDVNGSADVSATDALITLKVAVGDAIVLQCPACT
jgi:hypothetical protein